MEYKKFTDEQLDRAKNADLIEFLKAYMNFEFKKAGRYYQCVQHNSLIVYADRQGFVWNSRHISGGFNCNESVTYYYLNRFECRI